MLKLLMIDMSQMRKGSYSNNMLYVDVICSLKYKRVRILFVFSKIGYIQCGLIVYFFCIQVYICLY